MNHPLKVIGLICCDGIPSNIADPVRGYPRTLSRVGVEKTLTACATRCRFLRSLAGIISVTIFQRAFV